LRPLFLLTCPAQFPASYVASDDIPGCRIISGNIALK